MPNAVNVSLSPVEIGVLISFLKAQKREARGYTAAYQPESSSGSSDQGTTPEQVEQVLDHIHSMLDKLRQMHQATNGQQAPDITSKSRERER